MFLRFFLILADSSAYISYKEVSYKNKILYTKEECDVSVKVEKALLINGQKEPTKQFKSQK